MSERSSDGSTADRAVNVISVRGVLRRGRGLPMSRVWSRGRGRGRAAADRRRCDNVRRPLRPKRDPNRHERRAADQPLRDLRHPIPAGLPGAYRRPGFFQFLYSRARRPDQQITDNTINSPHCNRNAAGPMFHPGALAVPILRHGRPAFTQLLQSDAQRICLSSDKPWSDFVQPAEPSHGGLSRQAMVILSSIFASIATALRRKSLDQTGPGLGLALSAILLNVVSMPACFQQRSVTLWISRRSTRNSFYLILTRDCL